MIYRQDREFSKEPSCLLSNRSLKEPFGKEFRIKSQHTKGIPLPSPPVWPETVSTQGTAVILSNLMHPLNVFKDLNSGQTRFIVSHRKKKSIPAFMKQSWRLLSVIILTWAVNKKVVREAVRERGIPKCGYGLPNRE